MVHVKCDSCDTDNFYVDTCHPLWNLCWLRNAPYEAPGTCWLFNQYLYCLVKIKPICKPVWVQEEFEQRSQAYAVTLGLLVLHRARSWSWWSWWGPSSSAYSIILWFYDTTILLVKLQCWLHFYTVLLIANTQ